jgi:hypothetical protein
MLEEYWLLLLLLLPKYAYYPSVSQAIFLHGGTRISLGLRIRTAASERSDPNVVVWWAI